MKCYGLETGLLFSFFNKGWVMLHVIDLKQLLETPSSKSLMIDIALVSDLILFVRKDALSSSSNSQYLKNHQSVQYQQIYTRARAFHFQWLVNCWMLQRISQLMLSCHAHMIHNQYIFSGENKQSPSWLEDLRGTLQTTPKDCSKYHIVTGRSDPTSSSKRQP